PVELGPLGASTAGEPHISNPSIVRTGFERDQPLLFQGSQHSTHVAGVQSEPSSQVAYFGAVELDLPKRSRFAHRPPSAEEAIGQRADPLSDSSIEGPDVLNRTGIHFF